MSTKDLEIRGAGSVFGYSQSGGAQVGFDYYNKLLQRSVASNDLGLSFDSVVVDLFGEGAVIPSSFIEDVGVRLSVYKNLLSVGNHACRSVREKGPAAGGAAAAQCPVGNFR